MQLYSFMCISVPYDNQSCKTNFFLRNLWGPVLFHIYELFLGELNFVTYWKTIAWVLMMDLQREIYSSRHWQLEGRKSKNLIKKRLPCENHLPMQLVFLHLEKRMSDKARKKCVLACETEREEKRREREDLEGLSDNAMWQGPYIVEKRECVWQFCTKKEWE